MFTQKIINYIRKEEQDKRSYYEERFTILMEKTGREIPSCLHLGQRLGEVRRLLSLNINPHWKQREGSITNLFSLSFLRLLAICSR
jgi:hypothetical protein